MVSVQSTGSRFGAANECAWSAREAEAIYEQGREPVVDALLALSARLEAQDARLAALAERVEELEQRLKRDSRNSSLPPSHDRPGWASAAARGGRGASRAASPATSVMGAGCFRSNG
jgi:Family of unknown function (DUF6444)